MRLDRGLHIRCGLVRFTGFRPGIQAVHGDFGLLGQIQRFGQRIGGLPDTTLSVASTMDAAR